MGKKLIISESEKEQIRNLYQLNVSLINEETVGDRTEYSTRSPHYIKMIGQLKTPEEFAKKYRFGNFQNNQLDWSGEWANDYKRSEQEMMRKMDKQSLGVWKTVLQKNPMFYMYVLLQYNTDPTAKKRHVRVNNRVTIKQEAISTPSGIQQPSEPVIAFQEMSTELDPQPTLFVINEPFLTDEFKSFLTDKIINHVKEEVEAQSQDTQVLKVHVNKLIVNSSCSTAPNKQSQHFGKVPTFKELAEARGKVVYNFIVESMKNIGVDVTYEQNPSVMGVNSDGTNGNGTSGPEWSEVVKQGGNYRSIQQYQRADVTFSFGVLTQSDVKKDPKETPPSVTFIPKTEEDFGVTFTNRDKPKKLREPRRKPKTKKFKVNYEICPTTKTNKKFKS